MLQHLRQVDQVMFSVEVEKCNRGFEDFIPLADVVFISKVTDDSLVSGVERMAL